MSERRSQAWRAWIAAGVFLLLVAAAVLLLRPEAPEPPPDRPPPEPVPAPRVIPEALPPLGRADMLAAVGRAADAFAAGQPRPGENAALAGRRFVLVMPFGCDGPQPRDSGAPMFWSYDEETDTLRATVTPETFTDAAFARAVVRGLEYEAAEGFWIRRAWTGSEACPPTPPTPPAPPQRTEAAQDGEPARGTEAPEAGEQPSAAPPQARESLALIEFFEPGSRRAARRDGRPYRVVRRIGQSGIALGQGLRLVVEGRLAELPGGQPIGCWSENPAVRPVCVIRARVDRVAVTDASRQHVLGEWTN